VSPRGALSGRIRRRSRLSAATRCALLSKNVRRCGHRKGAVACSPMRFGVARPINVTIEPKAPVCIAAEKIASSSALTSTFDRGPFPGCSMVRPVYSKNRGGTPFCPRLTKPEFSVETTDNARIPLRFIGTRIAGPASGRQRDRTWGKRRLSKKIREMNAEPRATWALSRQQSHASRKSFALARASVASIARLSRCQRRATPRHARHSGDQRLSGTARNSTRNRERPRHVAAVPLIAPVTSSSRHRAVSRRARRRVGPVDGRFMPSACRTARTTVTQGQAEGRPIDSPNDNRRFAKRGSRLYHVDCRFNVRPRTRVE